MTKIRGEKVPNTTVGATVMLLLEDPVGGKKRSQLYWKLKVQKTLDYSGENTEWAKKAVIESGGYEKKDIELTIRSITTLPKDQPSYFDAW